MIGVDLNADHLAVAEIDRFGNLIDTHRLDTVVMGKTAHQRKALYGDAVKSIVDLADRQASRSPSRSWTSLKRKPSWGR